MDTTLTLLVDRIDRMIDAPDPDARWRTVVAERVRELRAAWVVHHVQCDGLGGLHQDLTENEPRVSPLVRRLRDESRRLIECCDFALAALRRTDSPIGEAQHALRELVAQARRYRARATSVTYEAVSVDVGGG
jgi:hypothetical protein